MSPPLEPCPRCGTPGPQLEKCHKPNGAAAWFCRSCTWIGDTLALSEAAPAAGSLPKKALKQGGRRNGH